ncbi:uncharacterized protein LOC129593757 [Paramacrobiotus metropolitanus]|uniref:uncharacterized protein LOC129593757 n=1 Tax=Paramacrobiotus metropolitanus TaxID=2943436 RepID=UPI002445629B|nr:uncharacterized protein LOC129593757 [Paramacrobiotus metropolitanus]
MVASSAQKFRVTWMLLGLLVVSALLSALLLTIADRQMGLMRAEQYVGRKFPYNGRFYLHYIRFKPENGKTTFRFLDYLSVMSAVNNLKPDRIIVHGDMIPTGVYWIAALATRIVEHRFRNATRTVGHRFGETKEIGFKEHSADISKLDVLLEFGGVVADFDVFFIRGERIKKILTQRRSIVCYGDEDGYNIGLIAGWPDSKLLYAWRRSYEDIYVNDWNFNQAFVAKYLSILYQKENYVLGMACNNPHPYDLESFFHEYGRIHWQDSAAIHTYERFGKIPEVTSPSLLYEGNLTTHNEMLQWIYEGRPLPSVNTTFRDEMDPLTDKLNDMTII